jgi:hypothetical protein
VVTLTQGKTLVQICTVLFLTVSTSILADTRKTIVFASVGDPEPDPGPQDRHVFGLLGSGSISQRYGSGLGYGSFPFLING